ncbi:hypothetical protein BDV98DRAFT_209 [Pterulicium gracile]|uniref:Uncharacterized protein n=1 Tax=Pterulicium gracile TaxID=1884261 RepID=A0A5C3R2G2_9AGAR|nr:hypothetical protein BDV98DRAFT_209 [Pterula gracilis]
MTSPSPYNWPMLWHTPRTFPWKSFPWRSLEQSAGQPSDTVTESLWPDRRLAKADSSKLEDSLKGIVLLMRRINPALDGTPAKIPFAAILSIADVFEAMEKLSESEMEIYSRLADRLEIFRRALVKSEENTESQARLVDFIEFLDTIGMELEKVRGTKTWRKVCQTPEIQAVIQELDRKLFVKLRSIPA